MNASEFIEQARRIIEDLTKSNLEHQQYINIQQECIDIHQSKINGEQSYIQYNDKKIKELELDIALYLQGIPFDESRHEKVLLYNDVKVGDYLIYNKKLWRVTSERSDGVEAGNFAEWQVKKRDFKDGFQGENSKVFKISWFAHGLIKRADIPSKIYDEHGRDID